ncbi:MULTISPECIES: hypothetical protein [Maricaulis]|jgi:hypothetical protein|uniref:Uncharacterized protein n=1 Tax=Maricaulis maris (strain MCS10) TaxID=394221 RepID=Q0AQE5_MARMM|nr:MULTISPECIES: hypothetical protein [Maricaulis]ABI65492.1 hypothetical protein Mmar10_1199 [Maricaulis maris MCS10]MAC90241.1 hypothetical protein [Maricaulis sp.]
MTMDDAFDARLKAAFAQAAEPLETETEADRFSQRVIKQLANPDRKRILLLGGAGSTGSAIAGTQLEGLLGQVQIPAEGLLSNVGFLMGPEVLAAGAMALAVGMVAMVLPRRLA